MGATFNPDGSVSIDMGTIKNVSAEQQRGFRADLIVTLDSFSLARVVDINKALSRINDPEIWKCQKRINTASKTLDVELQNLRNRLDDAEVAA